MEQVLGAGWGGAYLGHLLPVGFGVQGGLGEQDGVLLGGHSQLVVEGVHCVLFKRKKAIIFLSVVFGSSSLFEIMACKVVNNANVRELSN